jgi:hypothetical protein
MHDLFPALKSLREIPLFHGDQWEITVPSLLGIEQDEVAPAPKKLEPSKMLRMDSKDVVQKAQQEMQHLKRHFLVVIFKDVRRMLRPLPPAASASATRSLPPPPRLCRQPVGEPTLLSHAWQLDDGSPAKDEDPVISTDLTDSRQTFLGQCQMAHWQFNSLRHAQCVLGRDATARRARRARLIRE